MTKKNQIFFQGDKFSCYCVLFEQGAPENHVGMGNSENAGSENLKSWETFSSANVPSSFVKEMEKLFWFSSDLRYLQSCDLGYSTPLLSFPG